LTAGELTARLPEHNPIDRLDPLARAGVPLFQIHGDGDATVPKEEALRLMETALSANRCHFVAKDSRLMFAVLGTVAALDVGPPLIQGRGNLPEGEQIVRYGLSLGGIDFQKAEAFLEDVKSRSISVAPTPDRGKIFITGPARTVSGMLEVWDEMLIGLAYSSQVGVHHTANQGRGPHTVSAGVTMQLQQLEQDQITARVDMAVCKARLEKIDRMSDDKLLSAVHYIAPDPNLSKYKNQLVDMKLSIELVRKQLGPKHPDVVRLLKGIEIMEKNIRAGLSRLKKGLQAYYEVAKLRYERIDDEMDDIRISNQSQVSEETL